MPSIVNAQSNIKTSALTDLTSADSTDLFIVADVSASTSKKITYANLMTTTGTMTAANVVSTTNIYAGNSSLASADHILYGTGAVELNKQKASVDIIMSGDTDTNLLFLDGSADRVGIGTSTPTSILEVTGTLTVAGSGVSRMVMDTVASADPCTSGGSHAIPINSFFMKTGGIPCYCDASGVDKKIVDDSACF